MRFAGEMALGRKSPEVEMPRDMQEKQAIINQMQELSIGYLNEDLPDPGRAVSDIKA